MPDLDPFCFGTEMVYLKDFFKVDFGKKSAEDKKHGNFSRGRDKIVWT